MPSTSILPSAGEANVVSPINSSSIFGDNDSNSEEDRRDFSDSPSIEPALSQIHRSRSHQRAFRNFTRFIRRRQTRQQEYAEAQSLPPDMEGLSWQESSQCLVHQINQLESLIKWSKSSIPSSSYYFLPFQLISNDGGCHSPPYDVNNVLKNDTSVYCSGRTGTVNILLKYCGGRVLMDTTCVLERIVIRSPLQGFTAPCKEGLVFISHKPIDVKKTCQFDQFTKRDYDNYLQSTDELDLGDHNPIAWFNTSDQVQQIIPIGERSGKYVLIKLLRSDNDQENIDLEYIGFIGYTGARSFASSRRLL